MFEGGSGADAERLIAAWLPGYARSGPLHGHIAWHSALAALERGDTTRADVQHVDDALPAPLRHLRPDQPRQADGGE